jgi:hypothetical protein
MTQPQAKVAARRRGLLYNVRRHGGWLLVQSNCSAARRVILQIYGGAATVQSHGGRGGYNHAAARRVILQNIRRHVGIFYN